MSEPRPSFTREYNPDSFRLPAAASYISRTKPDDDRVLEPQGQAAAGLPGAVSRFKLTYDDADVIEVVNETDDRAQLSLFDTVQLAQWLLGLSEPVYVDITSLSFRVWAPILRAGLRAQVRMRVLYVEPLEYTRSTAGTGFSLSEYTKGIAPLPGFASVRSTNDDEIPLIPLLGFEGARFDRIVQRIEPPLDQLWPIIGVPGYQPEFPFHSYEENRHQLESNFLHVRVKYARANCPFDAFETLIRLHDSLGAGRIQVAPLGTRPHALGAALFALARERSVELIYDHPIRAPRPSNGRSRVCVYYLSEYLEVFASDPDVSAIGGGAVANT